MPELFGVVFDEVEEDSRAEVYRKEGYGGDKALRSLDRFGSWNWKSTNRGFVGDVKLSSEKYVAEIEENQTTLYKEPI
ncbi:MAG: hypothetical protein ABEK16_00625 [Candidatus Nanohalobium sp.]